MADEFQPQDYSRFLIREFLKKGGFEKTYDCFMQEDTRPKVTMTKVQLTKLLGIDALMKRNSKSKTFETMLDILCDFLTLQRMATGGVLVPEVPSDASQELATAKVSHKKTSSQVRKPQHNVPAASKTQGAWMPGGSTTNNGHTKVGEVGDDWGLDEEPAPVKEIPSKKKDSETTKKVESQPQKIVTKQQQPPKREVPALKKKPTATDDALDELDDLMGFGGGAENASESSGKQKGGDTLGFLKKSEAEKKKREDQKNQLKDESDQQYKSLKEIKHNLAGYSESPTQFDCSHATLPAAVRQQLKTYYTEEIITPSESNEIRKLLFKNASSNFHDSWHQGFFFDPKITYGIFQKEGGPCGILASVQAFFLKHLLFMSQTPLIKINPDKRENYLAAAIADILLNASDEGQNQISLVIPNTNSRAPILPTQCSRIRLNTTDQQTVYNVVKEYIGTYMVPEGHGVVCLVYSVLLTKGLQNIMNDMDVKDNTLLSEHGYATQELINVILVGRASSNVFNGEQDLGDNFTIKGIHRQSEVGFLTLYEAYGYFQVGTHFKNPKLPIWIICSESHYSVIFSPDLSQVKAKAQALDLVYYDELARQEDDIVLTVQLGKYKGPINLQETTEMIPPIDAVIRTRWDHGLVSWNGRQQIL